MVRINVETSDYRIHTELIFDKKEEVRENLPTLLKVLRIISANINYRASCVSPKKEEPD